jgi:hypothetical protein
MQWSLSAVAIAYLRAVFWNLLPYRGAQWLVAYLRRKDWFDHHANEALEFAGIANDLVYEFVLLPEEAPDELREPHALARSMDEVEVRRMRTMENRERWPQLGAAFVAALPPDGELTFDEAIDLVHRLAETIRGGQPIAIYFVIHDPALDAPGEVNRHAHLFASLRPVDRSGFLLTKIRGLFARPRRASPQNVHTTYIAEGINWPREYRELQQLHFLERGIDLVVDLALPVANRHFPEAVLRNEAQRVSADRQTIHDRNSEVISGSAEGLVDQLLRGRSSLHVAELERLLVRFIAKEDQRRDHVSRILADPAIVSLGVHAHDHQPSRLTTTAIHDLIQLAAAIVDDEARQLPSWLAAVSAPASAAVFTRLEYQIEQQPDRQLFLVGQVESHCSELAARLKDRKPLIGAIDTLLRRKPTSPYSLGGLSVAFGEGDLIVLTRSEQTDDRILAELIVAARDCGARLLLGFDESRHKGAISNRLAAYIADALDAGSAAQMDFAAAKRYLRCGRIDRALEFLEQAELLEFAPADDSDLPSVFDFLVCDDVRRIALLENRQTIAGGEAIDYGRHRLMPGDWIKFTKTDYRLTPLTRREGRLARIEYVLPKERKIVVEHAAGGLEEIDLREFAHLELAPAIAIREAYYVPENWRLQVDLTKPSFAWSCAFLLAHRGGNATLRVDPAVADDLQELIEVVRASLPGALSSELVPIMDERGEVLKILDSAEPPTVPNSPSTISSELDELPEPSEVTSERWQGFSSWRADRNAHPDQNRSSSPGGAEAARPLKPSEPRRSSFPSQDAFPRSHIPRGMLHEKLWNVLSFDGGQDVLNNLETLSRSPQKVASFEKLLKLCEPDSALEALIRAAMAPAKQHRAADPNNEKEIDFPHDLAQQTPRDWSHTELQAFRFDISLFRSLYWNRAFDQQPPEPPRSAPGTRR